MAKTVIVIEEIYVDMLSMYNDTAAKELDKRKAEVWQSPKTRWLINHNCRVKVEVTTNPNTIMTLIRFVSDVSELTEAEKVEFALRF